MFRSLPALRRYDLTDAVRSGATNHSCYRADVIRKEGRMNISITFRQMEGTDAVKNHAYEKISKLQKFLRQAMTAHVTLAVEGLDHVADVRVQSGSSTFHAVERRDDMYASLDVVVDKLERQIHSQKGATVAKKHGGMSAGEFAVVAERESQRGTRG